MSGATIYSSEDEASSDNTWSEWSDADSRRRTQDLEEEQQADVAEDGNQVAVQVGRPKKRKTIVDPPIPIGYSLSQKKKKDGSDSSLALFDGEVYNRSRQPNAVGVQQWRCVMHGKGCKSTIETDRDDRCIGKSKGGHSHVTAKVDLDMRAFKAQISVLALQDQAAPRVIHSNLVEHVSSKVKARVSMVSTAGVINYHRRKRDADPRTTTNPLQMTIPIELQNYKGNLFVLFDSGPSDRRIIIFSTPALIKFLENSKWWGFDGTFALVPKGWKQLLTLHAKQGESFIPCLHALLPKKSRRTYDRFFAAVHQLVPDSRVRHAHMDFERTLIASFEHHYNLAEKHGCFAHFARALYRKVQKLGLTRKYKEEGDFTMLFDMLKSLVYVPTIDLHEAFSLVIFHYARNTDGRDKFEIGSGEARFIDYFVQTWLGRIGGRRPMFPNELWNCFQLTRNGNSKTTNSLEAWHCALKLAMGSVDGKKPKFWRWLRQMKKECSLKESELVRLQSTPMKLKAMDKRIAQKRKELAENYDSEEMLDYLIRQSNFTVMDQF